MHKDYEIYKKRTWDGRTVYAFRVEYFGYYEEDTLEKAKRKIIRVKHQVARRLEEIEEENRLYYAKLNKKIELLEKTLHDAKHKKKN